MHIHNDEKTTSTTHLKRYERHQTTKVDDTGTTVSTHVRDDGKTMSILP